MRRGILYSPERGYYKDQCDSRVPNDGRQFAMLTSDGRWEPPQAMVELAAQSGQSIIAREGRHLPLPLTRTLRGAMGLQFWCSTAAHSLGQAMRELARACYELGYDVAIDLIDEQDRPCWARTSVRHLSGRVRPPLCVVQWGRSPHNFGDGRAVVEFDAADGWAWADPKVVKHLNGRVALLCLPAANNREEFTAAGVVCPTAIIPLGIDPNVYRPWGKDRDLLERAVWGGPKPDKDTFIFLVAGYLQYRKGLEEAVTAFQQAFEPDQNVALLVKSVAEGWGEPQGQNVLAAAHGRWRIGLLEESLDEWSMARLLSTADCIVNLHHREGFGLMPLQAMACGVPSILTARDGPMAYAHEGNAFLIPATDGTPPDGSGIPGMAAWYLPDVEATTKAMIAAAGGQAVAKREACLKTAAQYTWEQAARRLVAEIEANVGPVRHRRAAAVVATHGGLTVAAPVHNGQEDAERMALSAQTTDWPAPGQHEAKILLFDDASLTPVSLREGDVVRSEAWVGEGAARQALLERIETEWVFLTDADVEFTNPEWAMRLRDALADKPDAIAHPLMLDGQGRVWSAGGCLHEYGPPWGMLPAWHVAAQGTPATVEGGPILYAPGAGWFGRTEVLRRVWRDWLGGYFPTVFADVDMSYWARCAHGLRFVCVPESRVVHHHGTFTDRQTDDAERQGRFADNANQFLFWWWDRVQHDIIAGPQ